MKVRYTAHNQERYWIFDSINDASRSKNKMRTKMEEPAKTSNLENVQEMTPFTWKLYRWVFECDRRLTSIHIDILPLCSQKISTKGDHGHEQAERG